MPRGSDFLSRRLWRHGRCTPPPPAFLISSFQDSLYQDSFQPGNQSHSPTMPSLEEPDAMERDGEDKKSKKQDEDEKEG